MKKPGPTSSGYAGKLHDPDDPNLERYGMLGGPMAPDEPCVLCGKPTCFGSGRFPNRVFLDGDCGPGAWRCFDCNQSTEGTLSV